jgi:hypothetical protein
VWIEEACLSMVLTSQKGDSRGSNLGGFSCGSGLKFRTWSNAFESVEPDLTLTWGSFVVENEQKYCRRNKGVLKDTSSAHKG